MPRSQSTRSRVPSLAHPWPVTCGAIGVITPPRLADLAVLIDVSPSLSWRKESQGSRPVARWESSLAFDGTSSVAPYCNLAGLAPYYLVAILSSRWLPDGRGPSSSALDGDAWPCDTKWFGSACV